jgi:hypothetical protein
MVERVQSQYSAETLRVTDAGLAELAASSAKNRSAFDAHEALVHRVATLLHGDGRIVWTKLAVRCAVGTNEQETTRWRIAMPDVYSIRNSSKVTMLEPIVHEIKVRRSDLLSDLKNEAKREAYLDLSAQAFYVFPEHVGDPSEIPERFGVLIEKSDMLVCARFAPKRPCEMRFSTWMALAKARPVDNDEPLQLPLRNA